MRSRRWRSSSRSNPDPSPRLSPARGQQLTVAEAVVEARAYELDTFGHVNHAVHLNYFEQARFEALARCGFTYDELAKRGWAIHVVRIEVDYLDEVLLGDRLRIRTWTEGFRRTSMVMLQEARRDPRDDEDETTVVARARVVAVWIGDNGRPIRVPDGIRQEFGSLEAPTG